MKKIVRKLPVYVYLAFGLIVSTVTVLYSCKKEENATLNAASLQQNDEAATALKISPTSFKSILSKVSSPVKMEFLKSMIFVNGKIASFKYIDIKKSLSSFNY